MLFGRQEDVVVAVVVVRADAASASASAFDAVKVALKQQVAPIVTLSK